MTTALYRRYRPDTFDALIGQEHVTGALKNALDSGRVAHAYLFSGPRGCGKTTSARIMARSLNCAEGPTPTPCGVCASCVELASGGPGSLDVIEMDAASNGGVEDARNLRERLSFAPTRDRYRIFILDEAHMVSTQGFNALLKVVEEPPEYVKFIFATTEPDKVISTIRSRTHHYPFRLVAPTILIPYLQTICASEGVTVDESALHLVVRAGGGSVRDSLSILDQLIAGSKDNVSHDQAIRLLGFTEVALLDRVIEALGQDDGAGVFAVVEEIMDSGREPRRFIEDLLQRLRDMMVCALAGSRSEGILAGVPSDQLTRMQDQAQQWGTLLLSRRADLVEESLRPMMAATAPRLQLELLLARLLVEHPSAGVSPATPASPASAVSAPRTPAPHAGLSEVSAPAIAKTPTVVQPLPASASAVAAETVNTAPTVEEVRSEWKQILQLLAPHGALFPSLLQAVREVISQEDTVTFNMVTQRDADRFKQMNGEQFLTDALSKTFAKAVKAKVGSVEGVAIPEEEPAPAKPTEAKKPEPIVHEPAVPSSHAQGQENADDGRYRSMPVAEVVLDILGGQVLEETFEQPEGE